MDATDRWLGQLLKSYLEGQEPDACIRHALLDRAAGCRPHGVPVQLCEQGEGSGRDRPANPTAEEAGQGRAYLTGGEQRMALVAWAQSGIRPAL